MNKEEVDRAKANNDFYLNFSANIGYNRSSSETNSHTEGGAVTTITGLTLKAFNRCALFLFSGSNYNNRTNS